MKSRIELYTIEKVKERRERLDMNLTYFADCLNLSHQFISKIENPKTDKAYNLDHLNDIAVLLECSPQYFLPEKPFRINKRQKPL
ncbi:helix-turn-helix domain-containing protein [Butyricimonas virosa]